MEELFKICLRHLLRLWQVVNFLSCSQPENKTKHKKYHAKYFEISATEPDEMNKIVFKIESLLQDLSLERTDNARHAERISRYSKECGCALGGIFVAIAMVIFTAVFLTEAKLKIRHNVDLKKMLREAKNETLRNASGRKTNQ